MIALVFAGSRNTVAQPIPGGGPAPVITEIMYNPPEGGNDTLEFLEILNPSLTASINMEGYYFSSGIDFTFPAGFTLGTGEHVLIAGDSVIFETWYGLEAFEWEGQASSLSNSGEGIALRNVAGAVVDTVFFDDAVAWPQEADGDGYSLVLCDPTADNNLPESWTASENQTGIIIGTSLPIAIWADPGQLATCTPTGISDSQETGMVIYPNPSNGVFRIELSEKQIASIIRIYNMMGQEVHQTALSNGETAVELNTKLKAGNYILSIESADNVIRQKLTIQ
jgi:hypothetical protein